MSFSAVAEGRRAEPCFRVLCPPSSTIRPRFATHRHGNDTWHDAAGREVRTRSPSGIESRTTYLPLETHHWDGGQADASSAYEHTPTIERKDGQGRSREHGRTLDGKPYVARYTYNAAGALISRTDPEGNTATYEYDGRGRRIRVHDLDLGDYGFVYDATDNLIERTYPDGTRARFTSTLRRAISSTVLPGRMKPRRGSPGALPGKRKIPMEVRSPEDVYATVEQLVVRLRQEGATRLAATLEHRMRKVAWTTASELLEELRAVLGTADEPLTEETQAEIGRVVARINVILDVR